MHLVRETMSATASTCGRGARAVAAAYQSRWQPARRLRCLDPPVPALHLYAQPADPNFLHEQQHFADSRLVCRAQAERLRSHFPMLEVPREMARGDRGVRRVEHVRHQAMWQLAAKVIITAIVVVAVSEIAQRNS